MKFRSGFVTNSSSSSFICQVTGRIEADRDLSLEDAYMYQCEHGHTFGKDYLVGELDESYDENEEGNYNIPEKNCPICQMTAIDKKDLLKFLLKEKGVTEKDMLKEINDKFKKYDEFKEFIKGDKK